MWSFQQAQAWIGRGLDGRLSAFSNSQFRRLLLLLDVVVAVVAVSRLIHQSQGVGNSWRYPMKSFGVAPRSRLRQIYAPYMHTRNSPKRMRARDEAISSNILLSAAHDMTKRHGDKRDSDDYDVTYIIILYIYRLPRHKVWTPFKDGIIGQYSH